MYVLYAVDVLTVDWVCLHQANNGHFVFGALQNAFLCEVTNMYTGKVNVYTLLKVIQFSQLIYWLMGIYTVMC